MKKKISEIQVVLTVVFTTFLLLSNIIAAKQFQLPFGITMSGGAFLTFPVTYILSDLFSEVYGYRWSRLTCYLAFAMNLLMACIFAIAINLPAPAYYTGQEAFAATLGNTPRILAASLISYVLGDLVNDKVFRRMKGDNHTQSGFCTRAWLSSLAGEAIDSLVFVPVAFTGVIPTHDMLIMAVSQIAVKMLYETVILPVTNIVTKKVARYEEEHG